MARTKEQIERDIDHIMSVGYPGSESKEWKYAQIILNSLEEELKSVEQPREKINTKSTIVK
jgi:hypothetical protein